MRNCTQLDHTFAFDLTIRCTEFAHHVLTMMDRKQRTLVLRDRRQSAKSGPSRPVCEGPLPRHSPTFVGMANAKTSIKGDK
jgi:hypothetical protein